MTPQEFALKIRQDVEDLKANNRPLFLAANSVHALMSKRIFKDGLDQSDQSIGQYSTKDIWLNPDETDKRNSKGFNPLKGKSGNTEFKTNPSRKRKTSYFEGWKGYREVQGVKTDKVNLNLSGEMFSDFSRPVQKINPNEYVSSFNKELSSLKASGNEQHFGKTIFKLTKKERLEFFRINELELKLLFER